MSLLLRTALFTVLIPGTVTVAVPYVLLRSHIDCAIGISPALRMFGLLPLSAGITVYLWCAWEFATAGRGTPAPYDPPQLLVTRGLYTVSRNPIYIGVVLIILGEALLVDSIPLLGYALLLLALFHARVVLYEEPRLHSTFGGEYERYCLTVPRWVPHLR